jgi:hypothetical protein
MEPDTALHATITMEIAVMISGESAGWVNISNGTNKKPPPAPINVPIVPIAKPVSNKTILLSILWVRSFSGCKNFKDIKSSGYSCAANDALLNS